MNFYTYKEAEILGFPNLLKFFVCLFSVKSCIFVEDEHICHEWQTLENKENFSNMLKMLSSKLKFTCSVLKFREFQPEYHEMQSAVHHHEVISSKS